MKGAINRPVNSVFFMNNATFLAQRPFVRMRCMSRLFSLFFCALFASSAHRFCCWRAKNLHSKRMCMTVWFSCLHLHLPSSIPGTLRWKKNLQRSIFPVFIYTTSELSSLLSQMWSLIVLFLSASSSLCSSRLRRFLVHSSLHSFIVCLINWVYFADSNLFAYWAFTTVDGASSSLKPPHLRFFILQPVASFAALSVALWPWRPIWAGTQWISTVNLLFLRQLIACTMRSTICCSDLSFGNPSVLIAA